MLNPKAYVIIALMFSQFLGGGSNVADVATVSVVFTLNNLVAFTLWTLVGDAVARLLLDEANARHLNRFLEDSRSCGLLDAVLLMISRGKVEEVFSIPKSHF